MRTGLHRTGMALIAMLALAAAATATSGPTAVQLWGRNTSGELGDGTTSSRYWPIQPTSWPSDGISLASGANHVLVVRSDGTVAACGANSSGELGDGTLTDRVTPVLVSGLTGVVAVAASMASSMALKSDGTVWCWGDNQWGQLGIGAGLDETTPVQTLTAADAPLTDVVGISAGYNHCIAVKQDGTVWTWGYNTYGQLGDGTVTTRNKAIQVPGITTAVAVAAGGAHCMALVADGRVLAWGNNDYGQLGDGTTTTQYNPGYVLDSVGGAPLRAVAAVAAGGIHSVVLLTDGTVATFGANGFGQLGLGDIVDRTTPYAAASLGAAVPGSIAAGSDHTLAIWPDGTVRAWGNGSYGQLGDGAFTWSRDLPGAVVGITGATLVASGASSQHSLALAASLRTATSIYTLDRTATVTETMILRAYLQRVDTGAWLPGRTVEFKVGGTWVGSGVTNASGRADFIWTTTAGATTRTIEAHFGGEPDYQSSFDTATATCLVWTTKLGTFDRTQRIAKRTELKARLLRSDNVPIYNKGIDFSVDGTFVITRWTDVNGYARYEFYTVPDGAGAGSRTILSEWTGNDGYLAVSKTATLTVQPAQPYIWVMPKTGAAGSVVNLYGYFRRLPDMVKQEGKTLSVKVDGTWVANAVTDSGLNAGVARQLHNTTGLAVGAHTVTFEWAGDAFVEAGSGSGTLTITP